MVTLEDDDYPESLREIADPPPVLYVRGTLTAAVKSGTGVKVIVLKPAASISRCTSPTDQQHTGQAGTSTTTSARSSFRFRMRAGTVSFSSTCGLRI